MNVFVDTPAAVSSRPPVNQLRIWYPHVERIADDKYTGVLVVDEERLLHHLRWMNWSTPAQIKEANDLELAQINLAREAWPNAKIGLYGITGLRYWNSSSTGASVAWSQINPNNMEAAVAEAVRWLSEALAPVLPACDILCPTIYDPYEPSTIAVRDADRAWTIAQVRIGMAVAAASGKKCIPIASPCSFRNSVPVYAYPTEWWRSRIVDAVKEAGCGEIGMWGAWEYMVGQAFDAQHVGVQALISSVMLRVGCPHDMVPLPGDPVGWTSALKPFALRCVEMYVWQVAEVAIYA